MIPKRYLIATLFIAAMLVLLAVVQGTGPARTGSGGGETPATVVLGEYEVLAEFRLEEGWSPRFQGALDPDQGQPWPFEGGFGAPWEPPSPYLGDQGVALNGPGGRSEVMLWRGLEWRRYRFSQPLASARLDPQRGNRLLVTLDMGRGRFQTRLLEIPEGRVLWSVDSGPWSRFSWDGHAVLLGLRDPAREALLVTVLPVDGDLPPATLAPWEEAELEAAPRRWATRPDQLWDDGKDLPGPRALLPWPEGARLWLPSRDRLWSTGGGAWICWHLQDGVWIREGAGKGSLVAQPPLALGRLEPRDSKDRGEPLRERSPARSLDWSPVVSGLPPWPEPDPAWMWLGGDGACTAWDQRWGPGAASLPQERQRESLIRRFRPEWLAASRLRVSVRGWLPQGPEVALREAQGAAWVWVGDRLKLVRLQPSGRLRTLKDGLRAG